MRMIVFFDLPVLTDAQKRNYRLFHKFLIKTGFTMMQNSVYSKILLNANNIPSLRALIEENAPRAGSVCLMTITEKQFAGIEYLVGAKKSDVIDSDKRVIEL